MDEKKIIEIFLQHRILLSPENLAMLRGLSDSEVFLYASGEKSIQNISKDVGVAGVGPRSVAGSEYSIIFSVNKKPMDMTPESQLTYFASRYERMKRIYTERLPHEWVSLSNAPMRGDIWLLGLVKNIEEGEKAVVELEDPTGCRKIVFDKMPDCGFDDVVAVQAVAAGGVLFGKGCFYPDVPLRSPTTGKGRGCFVSDFHLEESSHLNLQRFFQWLHGRNVDWLFVAGDIGDVKMFEGAVQHDMTVFVCPGNADGDDKYPQCPIQFSKRNIVSLSNPAMLSVGGLNILLCHQFSSQQLRRRHLGPAASPLFEDLLCIDTVPDIVHYGHDHKPFVSNYKSVTMVNSGSFLTSFKPVIVDFASRECVQATV